MATRLNKHYISVRSTGNKQMRIPIKVSIARLPVTIFRTKEDIKRGVEGQACSCANAETVMRQAHLFPHNCHAAEFTDSRCTIVDKLDKRGVPIHGVVYAHAQNGFQKKYDRLGKKKMLASEHCEASVTLMPPPHYTSQKGARVGSPSAKDGSKVRKRMTASRGALARLERAGIQIPA